MVAGSPGRRQPRRAGGAPAEDRYRMCRPKPSCKPRSPPRRPRRDRLERHDGHARADGAVPEPAAVRSRRELPSVGVTIVQLRQRRRSVAEADRFQERSGAVHDVRAGRRVARAAADFIEASLAAALRRTCRASAGSRRSNSSKLLAGKLASASALHLAVDARDLGSAAPASSRPRCSSCTRRFTAPGDDPEAFALMKRQLEAASPTAGASPGQVFSEKLEQVNTSNHYTSQPLTPERVDDARPSRRWWRSTGSGSRTPPTSRSSWSATFKRRRSDPAARPLRRLACRRPEPRPRTSRTWAFDFPAAVERGRVEKGREPRSQTVISFFADPPADPMTQERIVAATTVLRDGAARRAARRARPDLHGVAWACRRICRSGAAVTSRCRFGVGAGEHRRR